MSNKDRIIRYLDQQMSGDEKSGFEENLKNSSSLRNELEDYRKLFNKIREVKEVPVDEKYFINLIPEFRKKIISGKRFNFYPAVIYGVISVIIIIFFSLIILKNNNEVPGTEEVVSSLNDNETEYILDNYSNTEVSLDLIADNSENYDSVLTNLLADNLISENSDINYIIGNSEGNLYNFTRELTESQAALVYDELINKKFF